MICKNRAFDPQVMQPTPGRDNRMVMRRRHFFQHAAALAATAFASTAWRPLVVRPNHPDPRPGITAANVLPADRVHDAKEEFEQVREIPQIIDGIRCPCGCADRDGFYSLLSCYEGDGMAQHCRVCQGCARIAHRMFKDNKTLADIRNVIDERFR